MVTVRWVIHSHSMLLEARLVKDEHPSDGLLHHGPASCLMLQVFPTSSVYLEDNGGFYRHTGIPVSALEPFWPPPRSQSPCYQVSRALFSP